MKQDARYSAVIITPASIPPQEKLKQLQRAAQMLLNAFEHAESMPANEQAESLREATSALIEMRRANELLISELTTVYNGPWEYYCRDCSHLRLYPRTGKPTMCLNCHSANIVVDKPGSEKLSQLRFGKT